jgi:Acyl-CoA carboxylase epsilon subunit
VDATLRVIKPEATPQEVAAITAALTLVVREREQAAAAAHPEDQLSEWVRGGRLTARRAGLQRGPWRLSGRIGRRSRA